MPSVNYEPIDCRELREYRNEHGTARIVFEINKLAEARGDAPIADATFSMWLKRRVPAERVLDVHRVTGIGAKFIRPDLYG